MKIDWAKILEVILGFLTKLGIVAGAYSAGKAKEREVYKEASDEINKDIASTLLDSDGAWAARLRDKAKRRN